jgi:hypothetical protein
VCGIAACYGQRQPLLAQQQQQAPQIDASNSFAPPTPGLSGLAPPATNGINQLAGFGAPGSPQAPIGGNAPIADNGAFSANGAIVTTPNLNAAAVDQLTPDALSALAANPLAKQFLEVNALAGNDMAQRILAATVTKRTITGADVKNDRVPFTGEPLRTQHV